MINAPYELLSREKIKTALSFYAQAGLIQNVDSGSLDAATDKALGKKYVGLDINYLLLDFDRTVFLYCPEDYGIAFAQQESPYSYALEQLVFDLAGFTNGRFSPEPSSIKFDHDRNGTLSFVQTDALFERELFAGEHYLASLLGLLNKAIAAHSGDTQELFVLGFSDAEQEAFVLLSKGQKQTAEQQGLLTFNC